ncbi:metal ABC transporter solute-binding protein, Zn/Mn family [Melghirimyces algeriensis]|uniref:Zinc transport system substrate-binding protein n=1 Tax=Melghirimyces algeriensis TaxID=910412 RepID=A0A521DKH9_9BACL|nr:zinc ABC transporter substrate-binding protein [Melghirimyces algeriensis]SMO72196.1 zinc transport system substrate-binding protein [Melghirimyces algeriensis]
MNRWMKRISVVFLTFSLLIAGCGGRDVESSSEGRLHVTVSVYPLQFFAESIGGKHVKVTNIVPVGVDPHNYEPTAREVAEINQSDMLLYNGVGFERWTDQMKDTLDTKKTLLVNTTKGVPLINGEDHHHHEEDHHKEHEGHDHEKEHAHEEHEGHDHEKEHGDHQDPHVWLDPVRAKQVAANIKKALIQKDPEHKKAYEKNYQELSQQLDQLDKTFKQEVKGTETKTFLVSHAAFGYIADRYGLNQVAVSGLSPSDEPSAKEMKSIVETARKHKVKYILFETLVKGKVAKAVQNEVGAQALTLHPLEGLTEKEQQQGEDYMSLMKRNAENLGKALGKK